MAGTTTNKKQKTRERMATRRAFVLDAMSRVCPQGGDQEWLERQVWLQQQATFKTLFEKMGYNDPSVGTGIDFIAWNVDCSLWNELQQSPADYKALNELLDQTPTPTDIPDSAQFHQYQRGRLGQTVEDIPPKQAKTETGALKRKSDTQDNKANDFHHTPKKLRQQELKFTTCTETSPKSQTSKPTTSHRPPTPTSTTSKAEGKQPLPIDNYMGPCRSTANTPTALLARLRTLTTTRPPPPPRNPSAWPRFIWRAVYGDAPPPRDGDFFALRLREAWLPHVDAGVLRRAHALLEPTVRVEVREREEMVVVGVDEEEVEVEGLVTVWLLAVGVADRAEVTSLRGLGYLAEVWGDVCEWHGVMAGSGEGGGLDLDGFMRERLLHRVAVAFGGDGVLCGREDGGRRRGGRDI